VKESALANTALFAALTEAQRSLIAERMVAETRRSGDLICATGKPATAMYLISSGLARLMTEQFTVLANLGPGSLLGEADVLLGRAFTVTAEAATDVTLLALSAADLNEIIEQQPEVGRQLRIMAGATEDMEKVRHLRRLNLMAGLGSEQLRDVAQFLRTERFVAGQGIYCRGTFGSALYLIDQGQVSVQRPGQPQTTISAGDIFGLSALLEDEPHTSDVAALTDVTGWSLGRSDFEKLALRYPTLALNLTRLLSQRLRQSNERVATASTVAVATAAATMAALPPRAPVVQYVAPAPPPSAPAAAATAAAVSGVSSATDRASSWFKTSSTGAKVRLAAVVLLLVWLIGVAAPALIINLLSGGAPARAPAPAPASTPVQKTGRGAGRSLQERVMLVALAADLPAKTTPTYTPWPTETPIPTPTFTPTATPTNTPIPTPTFTPTATPIPPTPTPIPPPPPVAVQAAAPAAAAAASVAAAAAAPREPPKPAAQFTLVEARRLTPCENLGKHHIFIKIVDAGGNPIDGVTLVQSPAGQHGNVMDKTLSGTKGPGQAEFTMWKGGTYDVYVSGDGANPGNTEIARQLTSGLPDEALCPSSPGGNTLFHNSFSVIFRKNF
jgi:CRP-like cAMP-binding protein